MNEGFILVLQNLVMTIWYELLMQGAILPESYLIKITFTIE